MDKDYFEVLGKYNKGANSKMNEVIKGLAEADWDKQFDGFFKSIHELCSHIFIGDYVSVRRFKSLKNFKSLTDEYFSKEYDFRETMFKSIGEYVQMRAELDDIIAAFLSEMAAEDVNKIVTWNGPNGKTNEKRLGICLLSLFNHGTHHRGTISAYLDMLGKDNDYSNLAQYG
ncbi:MAG: DinB family protein [Spirochaetaceae bacterium]|nr:DinB family protein [Spirochaetaceae bacterium]